jgi:hypothetical protein
MDQTGRPASHDQTGIQVRERIVIQKFDGDPPAEGENKAPVETIVIEDGKIVREENTHGTH